MDQLVRDSSSITDTFNHCFMDQQKHKQIELKDVMKYEWMRLASFAEFPSSSPAHPTRLAKSGFYFQGNEDEVTCFRCGVKHKGWKPGDVAENVHRDVSPQCPFFKETDTANFGIKESPWKLTNGHVNALSVHDNNISPNIGNLGCNETVTNAVSGKSGACGGPCDLNGTGRSSSFVNSSVKRNNDVSQQTTNDRKSSAYSYDNNASETNQLNTTQNHHNDSELRQQGSGNRPSYRAFDFSFVPSRSRSNEITSSGINSISGNSESVPNASSITNGNSGSVLNGSNITHVNLPIVQNSINRPIGNQSNITNGGVNNINQSLENRSSDSLGREAFGFVLEPLGISCEKPVYPQYAISATRMSSFKNWPKFYKQRPDELTKAGLFYEGKDDRVRCFFCGGGLFNWEENDDPWVEHARWFPKCVYLRQSKSDEFIYKVHQEVQRGITDFSHLKDYKPGHRTQTPSASTTLDENGVLPSASVTSDKNDVMSHPAVISVLDMGTDKTLVKKAVETINKLNGTKTLTAEKLLLKVWEIQDLGGTETVNNNNEQPTNGQTDEQLSNGTDIPGSADTKTDDEEAERLAIIEENRHLRELQLCKICLDEDVSIVFLPCGHMATCASCAPALRKCPICRQFIKGTVKAIIS